MNKICIVVEREKPMPATTAGYAPICLDWKGCLMDGAGRKGRCVYYQGGGVRSLPPGGRRRGGGVAGGGEVDISVGNKPQIHQPVVTLATNPKCQNQFGFYTADSHMLDVLLNNNFQKETNK